MTKRTIHVVTCGVIFQDCAQSVTEATTQCEVFPSRKAAVDFIKLQFAENAAEYDVEGDNFIEKVDPRYDDPGYCYQIWKRRI